MEPHFKLTDTEFITQFKNCTLHPELFSHEAHLRLGWIYINTFGLEKAEETIQQQIQNFVAHLGAQDKYNTTVTIVALKAIYHFMQHSKANNFKDFITENPKLKANFKALIKSHYRYDVFKSEKAKSEFIPPDLLPFN